MENNFRIVFAEDESVKSRLNHFIDLNLEFFNEYAFQVYESVENKTPMTVYGLLLEKVKEIEKFYKTFLSNRNFEIEILTHLKTKITIKPDINLDGLSWVGINI